MAKPLNEVLAENAKAERDWAATCKGFNKMSQPERFEVARKLLKLSPNVNVREHINKMTAEGRDALKARVDWVEDYTKNETK